MGLLALAACSTQPTTAPVDAGALEIRAARELEAGNVAAAAQLYRDLADAARGPARSGYLLEGVRLLVMLEDWARARLWLDEAAMTADAAQALTLSVLRARVEIALGQPDAALARLAELRPPFSLDLSRDIAEVRGRALFALGRLADAVRTLVEREIWLDSAEAIRANQRLIWDGLAAAPAAEPEPTGDPVIDGWLALRPLTRLADDETRFRQAIIDWRRQYANHPAAAGILAEVMAEQRSGAEGPTRIALLLPLGSVRRTQAVAVRDGFLAAHLAGDTVESNVISVYDTALRGSAEAYLAAQLDGADFIVGPLLPDEISEVVDQTGLVPTLALNFVGLDTGAVFPPGFYQYALAPEDEARAIAERAIAAGHETAIALFGSNDRGYRLENSFRTAFEALGGRVLNAAAYVPESQDFTQPITEVLNVARSQQRFRRLQANLGRPIEFEPRRREDIDMIFLQADPRHGRLLAPQLRFHDAGDIPTYATSDIYDTARRSSDFDLNGVMFPDLPLLVAPDEVATGLSRELEAYWPDRARQYIRLYAFGYDAYRLVNRLNATVPLEWPMHGVTGELGIDLNGRIRRGLPFAQFQSGRPVAIPELPAPLDPFLEPRRTVPNVFGAR